MTGSIFISEHINSIIYAKQRGRQQDMNRAKTAKNQLLDRRFVDKRQNLNEFRRWQVYSGK
jgi:hypothetical protein